MAEKKFSTPEYTVEETGKKNQVVVQIFIDELRVDFFSKKPSGNVTCNIKNDSFEFECEVKGGTYRLHKRLPSAVVTSESSWKAENKKVILTLKKTDDKDWSGNLRDF